MSSFLQLIELQKSDILVLGRQFSRNLRVRNLLYAINVKRVCSCLIETALCHFSFYLSLFTLSLYCSAVYNLVSESIYVAGLVCVTDCRGVLEI